MRISVVVATAHEWPEIADCLAALTLELERLDGEVVIADGHGEGVPEDALSDRVRVVRAPGADVFELRALGLASVRAPVVAITEDHCVPGPRWAECLLDGMERHPEASVIAGATRNGSPASPVDRANFLMTFAETIPPLDRPSLTRVPPPNNLALRASVAAEAAGRPGHLEHVLLPRLWAEGAYALHRDAVVAHVQSHGTLGTLAVHFANGRASAGQAPAIVHGRGLAGWVGQPARLVAFVVRALRGKGLLRGEWASVPIVGALAACHVAGEATGTLRGPGDSARALS